MYGQGGNDHLLGSHGNNILSGGDGDDTIDAGINGNIAGEFDRVDGGKGNDTIYAQDGNPDQITCGAGSNDRVTADVTDDVDLATCELVKLFP